MKLNADLNKYLRGFINLKGEVIIPIKYNYVFYEGNGLISVEQNKLSGVIDTLNQTILPIIYEDVNVGDSLIITIKNNLKDIYNLKGIKLNKESFLEIYEYHFGKAVVFNKNKTTSIINYAGEIILNAKKGYKFVYVINNDLYLIRDEKTFLFGVSDKNNNLIIPCKYQFIDEINNFFKVKQKNKYGFINLKNEFVKKPIYDEIYLNKFDQAVIFGNENIGENCMVKIGENYGIINPNQTEDIINIKYKFIKVIFGKYYLVQDFKGLYAIFNKNGKRLTENEYKIFNYYENNIFTSKNGKSIILNLNEDLVIEQEIEGVEFIEYINLGLFSAIKNQIFKQMDKYGVISINQEIVIPNVYDFIGNIYESNEYIVKKDNFYGIVNTDNKVVVPLEYDKYQLQKEIIKFYKNKEMKHYHNVKFRD